MLLFSLNALIVMAIALVIMWAPSPRALLVRAIGCGLIALLWLPATTLLTDAFADPLYRKDYIVASVLMSWVFMGGAALGFVLRLFLLMRNRRPARDETAP